MIEKPIVACSVEIAYTDPGAWILRQGLSTACISIAPWMSNYIHCKVWDEITYPLLNFNSATVEV